MSAAHSPATADVLATGDEDRTQRLRTLVRDVPDFPQPGILFRDLTGVFAHPTGLADVAAEICARSPQQVDLVAGLEARGFVVGAAVAAALGVGFVPVRKAGKLPPPVDRLTFELEYGHAEFEVRTGTVERGSRVLVVDDLLATGGTARAAGTLLGRVGATVVGYSFLVELEGLPGRSALEHAHAASPVPVTSVLQLPA